MTLDERCCVAHLKKLCFILISLSKQCEFLMQKTEKHSATHWKLMFESLYLLETPGATVRLRASNRTLSNLFASAAHKSFKWDVFVLADGCLRRIPSDSESINVSPEEPPRHEQGPVPYS